MKLSVPGLRNGRTTLQRQHAARHDAPPVRRQRIGGRGIAQPQSGAEQMVGRGLVGIGLAIVVAQPPGINEAKRALSEFLKQQTLPHN